MKTLQKNRGKYLMLPAFCLLTLIFYTCSVTAQADATLPPKEPVKTSTTAHTDSPDTKPIDTKPIDPKDSLTVFQSLVQEEVLQLNVKTNLKQLIRRKAQKEKHPAVLSIKKADDSEKEWTINIQARGNMRNRICFLPPLKIDFVKGDLQNEGLKRKYDDLKLVVRCQAGDLYENFVLREYLIYKMYNIITDKSFNVQLAKLKLQDTEGKQKDMETYAFLIEKDDELAARINGKVSETKYMKRESLYPEVYDQMVLFQFMIGNTDWHVVNKHNLKIFRVEGYNALLPIAYDFDYAGIVGAPYAVPNVKLPLENVKDRFFLGRCRTAEEYAPTIQLFKDKKAEIMACVDNFTLWNEKAKKSTVKYLEDFFEILESPKAVKRMIIEHCDKYVKVEK